MDAVLALKFTNRAEAFKQISEKFNKENNYLKLRRAEFDALTESKSTRKGWRNRPPAPDVLEFASILKSYNFDELTDLVLTLLENELSGTNLGAPTEIKIETNTTTEEKIEHIINFTDNNSLVKAKEGNIIT